jgi:hypothetical protein
MTRAVPRDERELAIDGGADRLTAAVLSFGILILVMVRSARGETAWDLLALVVAGGFVGTAYRIRHRAADGRWFAAAMFAAALGAVAAIAIALVGRP